MAITISTTMNGVAAMEPDRLETNERQAFGFWLYLMSDLVMFAVLFATYLVVGRNFAGGPSGRELFDLSHPFVETLLLLFSSAACGVAMTAMDRKSKGRLLVWFGVTFALGLGFITMEFNEFHRMILDGNGPTRSAFLSAFFALVGTHGAHVSIGLIWILVMAGQVAAKGLTQPVASRLIRLSMFWHFLDIVWVGVFTIVYLMGVM